MVNTRATTPPRNNPDSIIAQVQTQDHNAHTTPNPRQ
ncbi:hypothetical protein BofuT4_uP089200.1 [Botrytis cinerea T4]|uniref:Uncharacterized protein n=1 Tax=Botryotinia fuckeliana (strain T4) TaxID=999810 RepID=G2YFH3_BOTF4|nr:hypothetical protein BofuT4_uP089200.1 [Botrytis cinerea T4]